MKEAVVPTVATALLTLYWEPKSRTDHRGNFPTPGDRHRCGLGSRVQSANRLAKLRALRDGAAIASKKLWS